MLSTRRRDSRQIALALAGVFTTLTLLILIVCMGINSSGVDHRLSSMQRVTLSSAILNAIALSSTSSILFCRLIHLDPSWVHRRVLPWLSGLVSVGASLVTLDVLVFDMRNQQNSAVLHSKYHLNTTVTLVIWALSAVGEVCFFLVLAVGSSSLQKKSSEPSSPVREKRPQRPPTPPTPLRIVSSPRAIPPVNTPPPMYSAELNKNSWRDSLPSLHKVVRPVTSRTKLLGRQDSTSTESQVSDTRPTTSSSIPDAFDSWETSSLESQTRETSVSVGPSKGTALEPIPGSRPVSPARVLDGPFENTSEKSSARISQTVRSPEPPPIALSTQPRRILSNSRPSVPSIHELHIHPLFRTDSPTPPPITSPGTIVVASPFSGQVINAPRRSYTRSWADSNSLHGSSQGRSRPNSRGPILSSASTTRPGSFEGRYSCGSRSSSPVSGTRTPPIPEFVLSASRERII